MLRGKRILQLATHPPFLCVWVIWVLRAELYIGATEHDVLRATITGKQVITKRKRTVHVTVGKRSYIYDFFFGNIQDKCIIGLDLLELWCVVIDVAARICELPLG